MVTEHQKVRLAREQVEAMTGFYIHLIVYVLVISLLFAINAASRDAGWWAQWPLIGWGLGIGLHSAIVFGKVPNLVRRWQLRKIRQLSTKM